MDRTQRLQSVRRAATREASIPSNALGEWLVLFGAVALFVSMFLPLLQPAVGMHMVEHNTVFQVGAYKLLALPAFLIASGYYASLGMRAARWSIILSCAASTIGIVMLATDRHARTLYPDFHGYADMTQPGVVAGLGVAIYVAGVGIAAAFIGGLTFFRMRSTS